MLVNTVNLLNTAFNFFLRSMTKQETKKCGREITEHKKVSNNKPNDMHTQKSTVAEPECAYGWMTSHPVQDVHTEYSNNNVVVHT